MDEITSKMRKVKLSETGENQDNCPDKRRYDIDMAKDKEDKGQDNVKITAYLTVISDGYHRGIYGRPIGPIGVPGQLSVVEARA